MFLIVKSYVYRHVFAITIDFYGDLGANPVFGRNHVFAFHEQHATVRKKLSPQSAWKSSKVPHYMESCFFILCAPLPSLFFNF